VGMAYTLSVDDFIFGSHRSHGEILAKGLSAIHQLDENSLMKIMKEYFDGVALKVVEKYNKDNVKDLAIDFLLYGTLAEIFARENGFNKGLGGSMHAFFPPFGVYPNNAIVGGSGDISVGAALFKKVIKNRVSLWRISEMLQWVAVLFGKVLVLLQWTSLKPCGRENLKVVYQSYLIL